jgi:very-short-patch-repair endonuclease
MESKKRVKIELARKYRQEPTKAEERLWWLLRNRFMLGFKFRRQYLFRGFIIDFYCPRARLAIELDGGIHEKQQEYDQARQKLIENYGIRMLRFKNMELFKSPDDVLNKIIMKRYPRRLRRGYLMVAEGASA